MNSIGTQVSSFSTPGPIQHARKYVKGSTSCTHWRQSVPRSACVCSAGENSQFQGHAVSSSRSAAEKALRDAGIQLKSARDGPEPSELIVPHSNGLSWDEWKRHADSVDELLRRAQEVRERLDSAVWEERYSEAAACKQELDEIFAKDEVAKAAEELRAAIGEERFADAAAIRDSTASGLIGWWADPFGHVLRISRRFGRLVAAAYTPSALAEMKGWTEENPLRQDSAMLAQLGKDMGRDLLELYLLKDKEKGWLQQAAVLRDAPVPGGGAGSGAAGDADGFKGAEAQDTLKHLPSDITALTSFDGAEPSGGDAAHTVRVPATLVQITRDQIMIVPEPPAGGSGNDAGVPEPRDSAITGARVEKDDSESEDEGQRMSFKVVTDSGETISIQLDSSLKEALDQNADSETWGRVADAVSEMQERISPAGGPKASREELADSIRTAIEELISDSEDEDGMGDAGDSPDALSITRAQAEPSTYMRLDTEAVPTDPFSGLYLGAFGPHGPELIRFSRTVGEDGNTYVEGIKVTGDRHVPSGNVSFRAKIGRKNRLPMDAKYPEELGVVARYKGEGHTARPGFTDPKWVEGELLVFKSTANPSASVTGGAELGFVWEMPTGKKLLILMNRVDFRVLEFGSQDQFSGLLR
uniref:Protein executer chloroplastic-like n=1 Tax=Tetraselmis sp. GSL018 TaxID=582737 RepID=A0A061RFB5_9CHLO|eukprot:CAMPEP_0177588922 /NCGR_PEP_ID=MMETSP0419_2-20121207/6505_1 /TAXON_ID=582737 /ORGANISM="Tetraselmis sp., Strain GSL018" /LENGTH=642 /DNA_ID=CAMNT_0019079195 /DNA_START=217 /DNA_END=2145 /DNA_ORIENTATION=+